MSERHSYIVDDGENWYSLEPLRDLSSVLYRSPPMVLTSQWLSDPTETKQRWPCGVHNVGSLSNTQ